LPFTGAWLNALPRAARAQALRRVHSTAFAPPRFSYGPLCGTCG
jgi:hypothetical protein